MANPAPIDLTNAPTTVLTRGDEHERLAKLAGSWTGVVRTWLDPTKPPAENEFTASAKLVLGGRFLRIEYRHALDGTPIAGELIVAFEREEERWSTAWVDSFHTGSAILFSTGVPRTDGISVFGEYFVKGHPRWGWRTNIHDDRPGELIVRMYNVSPEKQEDLGVEIELRRAPGGRKRKKPAAKRRATKKPSKRKAVKK